MSDNNNDNNEVIEDFSGMTQVNGVVVNPPNDTNNNEENEENEEVSKYDKYSHKEDDKDGQMNESNNAHIPMNNIVQQKQIQPKIGLLDRLKRIGPYNIIILIAILAIMLFLGWRYLQQ